MEKNKWLVYGMLFCLVMFSVSAAAAGRDQTEPVKTNKGKLLTLAVQGEVASAQPQYGYGVTWNGQPKTIIGTGGINYNLKIGDKVFGWASADQATVGVSTVGAGSDRSKSSYLDYTSIGNEAKIISGDAKGDKGVIVGKFADLILVHFEDKTLEKLTIGDKLHVKACGMGLAIDGFDKVFVHSIAPEVLEDVLVQTADGKLEAPVVKKIPGKIVSRGRGGTKHGHWHIQTCYPPDIEQYGLDELRFGDLVLLKDIQTDYGQGYYKGGVTLGIVCGGPSDLSGRGIGVTPILSSRFGEITARIDADANIAHYLGIKMKKAAPSAQSADLPTNKDQLITTAVEAVVQPAGSWGYSPTYDGRTTHRLGTASINYTVGLGDSTYGWANADHVEPDVTVQGRDQSSPSACAIAILACIGNEAKVLSGDAKGEEGIYIGRHAGSDDLVWFPKNVKEKLTLNDRIQVKARGVGLKIDGFEDVRVNKLSPEILGKMGIRIEGDQLVVPVVMEVPGHIMGSGIGYPFIEALDYDIQTTDPETVKEYDLTKLRLGDVVAIRDHYDAYGTGRYEGAVTIGVCIHGFSDSAGHGPGLNPVLSALPGKIKTVIDPDANTAVYLGIKTPAELGDE